MKKAQIIICILSLAVSALSLLYVAVGAAAEVPEANEIEIHEYVTEEKERFQKYSERREKESVSPPLTFSLDREGSVSFTLYSPSRTDKAWAEFATAFTFENPRYCKSIPEGIITKALTVDCEGFTDGKLSDGYAFFAIDATVVNKGEERDMVLLNMIRFAGREPLCFSGQKYKNSAAFHMDLDPGESFSTTLIFVCRIEEFPQLTVNPDGSIQPDGGFAIINLELENQYE